MLIFSHTKWQRTDFSIHLSSLYQRIHLLRLVLAKHNSFWSCNNPQKNRCYHCEAMLKIGEKSGFTTVKIVSDDTYVVALACHFFSKDRDDVTVLMKPTRASRTVTDIGVTIQIHVLIIDSLLTAHALLNVIPWYWQIISHSDRTILSGDFNWIHCYTCLTLMPGYQCNGWSNSIYGNVVRNQKESNMFANS